MYHYLKIKIEEKQAYVISNCTVLVPKSEQNEQMSGYCKTSKWDVQSSVACIENIGTIKWMKRYYMVKWQVVCF